MSCSQDFCGGASSDVRDNEFRQNHAFIAERFAGALLVENARWTDQSAEQGQQDDITLLLFDFEHP
jgi:hypothetical protein